MLLVTNYSYIVAAPPIFTALTRSFEIGTRADHRRVEQPRQTQCRCELMLVLLR